MVKLVFNESENTLTVSLVSYRDLFVFQDDVPFQQAIKGDRLRPDRLPYVVQSDPKAQFVLDKSLKASLEKPHKKLLFHRWITYQGLQPQPIEYKMVNEFIEQTFDIQSDVARPLRHGAPLAQTDLPAGLSERCEYRL